MKKWKSELSRLKILGQEIDDWEGGYAIAHPKIREYYFQVIVGTGMDWDHVSVCVRSRGKHKYADEKYFVQRTPFWAEMCWIKDFFFDKDEVVMQIHPQEVDYVNIHDFVLHLWKPQKEKIPCPQTIMV
jgi:hypothetical protein